MEHLTFQGVVIVTLLVGEEKVPIKVHKDLLCGFSPVFRATFKDGRFRESRAQSMKLPEDDPEIIDHMVHWMYSSKLRTESMEYADGDFDPHIYLASLNGLAEKYDIKKLTNAIVDAFFGFRDQRRCRILKDGPKFDTVEFVYKTTTENSSFRKLLVAWHAYESIEFEWLDWVGIKQDLLGCPEYAVDLAIAMGAAFKGVRDPFSLPKSDFYVKDDAALTNDG